MKRRDFVILMSGAAAAWPFAAHAQQPAMPVIGFLSSRSPGESAGVVAGFRQGLTEAGFVEGQNVLVAFRWAEGHYDRLPALAAELVGLRVAVLFTAGGPPAAFAAKAATQTIPIVFSAAMDPERIGLVTSLNRPGGNITGMSLYPSELAAKSVQLLKRLLPSATLIGYLINPSTPAASVYTSEASAAANALGISIHILNASTEQELDELFASLPKSGIGGLAIPAEPFFDSQRDRIVALAARYSIPAIYGLREYAVAGGLMSYGTSLPDTYRRAAVYAGRVLKGEKPADLPVVQPTNYDLVLNMKTAKSLGLNITEQLLALADEVIE
ncbi:MAG TPA: ABC transporter substrate-binding protein [Xanthobacteraceae bacterium]|nr:ABC transporter substrate-binding protein [Xanthobacteraceae bacterium]